MPGSLSPALAELAVHLGSEVPFGRAARLLSLATGTTVSAATVQRLTERVGAAWRQVELELVDALETAALDPAAPPVSIPDAAPVAGDTMLQLSVDGAMAPLVGGVWAEARTAAIGRVTRADDAVHTTDLSYVSHVTDAETFTRLALAELTRRGVGAAARVVAVTDGAVWIQGFLDLHCPQATRVLDFAHAAGYLAQAAQAAFGAGAAQTSEWFGRQRHELRHGDPDRVLAALAALSPSEERATALGYLTPRRAMLAYAQFDAAGLPVGSGCVESANKVVIEARLKGAGMHWTRPHADAMVGLRTLVDTDRWAESWRRIVRVQRAEQPQRAARRRRTRGTPLGPPPSPSTASTRPVAVIVDPSLPRPKLVLDGRPTADHPWRQPFLNRRDPVPTKM